MNHQQIKIWLTEHNIILEQGFVESLREYARTYKKKRAEPNKNLCRLRMYQNRFVPLGL